ncbi:MAG TPA: FAD-dependent oxidoreductase [Verrucomicrobiae bacterium]|jgi:ferredoxin-NADP reductase|nr:FAD-dependent oxidoreductase [Verrucomicrobiae bacterium]
MKVVFDHSEDEAANITTFYFRPEKLAHYTAGQFTELLIPHAHPDKRGQKRWFTLSSSPTDELLSITTKFAASEGSSFKKALRKLQPGTQLTMADPMGDFVLPKLIQTPLVFVAGGIGITPFHSILKWLATTAETRPIKLLYGVHSEDEIIFQPTFDAAKIHPVIVVNEPSSAWGGERGNLSAELILGLEKPSEDTLVYVSGPEPMVEHLEKDLRKAGLNKNQFVGDFFPNYTSV